VCLAGASLLWPGWQHSVSSRDMTETEPLADSGPLSLIVIVIVRINLKVIFIRVVGVISPPLVTNEYAC
jgi:hypothetical protein